MAEVFISFIHEQEDYAKAVKTFIRQTIGEAIEGVFLASDKGTVYAGELWFDRIVQELKAAKVVISLLSKKSVSRPWVNFEAGAAWFKEDTALIPVCFRGVTKGDLPKPYSSLQALDLDNYADQYYLVSSVAHYLNIIQPTPPPPFLQKKPFADPAQELLVGLYRRLSSEVEALDAIEVFFESEEEELEKDPKRAEG